MQQYLRQNFNATTNFSHFHVHCKYVNIRFDVLGTVYRWCLLLSITNKMQCYTIFFTIVNVLHVSGGFSAPHQELKNCTHSIGYMPSLLAATACVGELELATPVPTHPMLCVQFLSSWWWAEKPPETCRTLTIVKNIV